MNRSIVCAALLLVIPAAVAGQDRTVNFQRRLQATEAPVTVFHSTQSANLPTAETLTKGEWQFEISHRFLPPFSDGADALWGLDGPIYNRLGLTYAVTDRAMVAVERSNLDDNLELGGKVRLLEGGGGSVPYMLAIAGGIAWNTAVVATGGFEDNESQAYAQLVMNALLGDRLAVGVVPSFLHNPRIADVDKNNEVTVGLNAQLYVADQVSVLGEWNVSASHEELEHDAATFGLELETGGHFFKLLATNSARLNPTQFLGGTPYEFKPKEWRFGFNVTRLLVF